MSEYSDSSLELLTDYSDSESDSQDSVSSIESTKDDYKKDPTYTESQDSAYYSDYDLI